MPVQLLRSICNSRFPGDTFLLLTKNSTIGLIDSKYDLNYFNIVDLSFKITNIRIHPLNSYLLFCLTPSDGILVYDLEKYCVPSVAIPRSPISNSTIRRNILYYTDGGDSLSSFRIPRRKIDKIRELSERSISIEQVNSRAGYTHVELSPTGNYISLLWDDFTHYQIFEVGTWKLIEEGNAIQLVWSTTSDRFAILQPRSSTSLNTSNSINKELVDSSDTLRKSIGGNKLKKRVKESVASLYQVNVKQIDFSQNCELVKSDLKTVYIVEKIKGGMLLSLVNKHVSSLGSAALTESTIDVMENPESTNLLQFFDWDSLLPIGEEIPTPLNIFYDPLQVY